MSDVSTMSRSRKRIGRRRSRRMFRKGSMRINRRNRVGMLMRGGYRL